MIYKKIKDKSKYLILVTLIIVSFSNFFYFLSSNISVTGDYLFHLSRIENIYNNLKIGVFLPVIDQANMNGLGYLIDIFYPNLFFYLPAIFRFILPVNIALQLAVSIYNIIFGISYIKIINKLFNDKKLAYGFTFLYLSSYYLFVDLISRQAISEYFATLIIPLVLFGTFDLLKNNKWKLLAISMTLITYTHLLSLVTCSALILIILIFNYKKILKDKSIIISFFKATFATVFSSLAFLLPFIRYYTTQDYFLKTTSHKFITINTAKDILYIIGFFLILIIMFIIYNCFCEKINKVLLFAINGLIFSIYLYTDICNWDILSFFYIFQYKIRIVLLINIFLVIILSYIIKNKAFVLKLFLITFFLLFIENTLGNIYNEKINETDEATQLINDCTFNITKNAVFNNKYCEIVFAEYLPLNLIIENKPFINSCSEKSIIDNSKYLMSLDFKDIEQFKNGTSYKLTAVSKEIIIPKIYYQTYRVYQKDNNDIKIENFDGFIKIKNINDGEFILKFGPTFLQYFSFIISLISIFCIFIKKHKAP